MDLLTKIRSEEINEIFQKILENTDFQIPKVNTYTEKPKEIKIDKSIALLNEVKENISLDNSNIRPLTKIFEISKTKNILFNITDKYQLEKIKINILDLTNIEKFIANNNLDEVYIKIINNYKNKLNSKLDNLNKIDLDDEFCEISTNKIFNIIEKFFIDKLFISLFRTISNINDSNKVKIYTEFIDLLNNYLYENSIYTYDISVDAKIKDDDFNYIDLMVKKTDSLEGHNKIVEIEKLPYLIDYIDEYEEIQTISSKGKVTILSTKN